MNSLKIIIKEIFYRKLNFLFSSLAVSTAVAFSLGAFSILTVHDLKTRNLLDTKIKETEQQVKALEDDMRKITKKMGFNVLILPADQNLDDFYSDNYASKFMPEDYVHKLAISRLVTVRHLLPTLEQKVKWIEKSRTVILVGIRGEVPIIHQDPKKPIVSAVKSGTVVVGYNLAKNLGLKVGQNIFFLGEEFTVDKIYQERGNKDDITVWMDLKQAQKLLNKEGLINGIMALECKCAWADIDKVREDIKKILPNTKVISFAGKAEARKAARERVELSAKTAILNIKKTRAEVRGVIEKSAAVIVPLIIIIAAFLVAALALSNTRERRYEIGLMRALGVSTGTLFKIFILRAVLLALIGTCIGIAAGVTAGFILGYGINKLPLNRELFNAICNMRMIGGIVVLTPLLTVVASWVPALSASQKDPAEILREE